MLVPGGVIGTPAGVDQAGTRPLWLVAVLRVQRRRDDRVALIDHLLPVGRGVGRLPELAVVRRRKVRDVDDRAVGLIARGEHVGVVGVDLVLPDEPDLRLGGGEIAGGEAPLTAPALVGHEQREGHVLVAVGGRAGAEDRISVGADVPVHQPVVVQEQLLVLPEIVEGVLVVGVDGQQHPVPDPLRVARVDLGP